MHLSLSKLAERAVRSPMLFVTGAGISVPSPSHLPIGRTIARMVYDACAPESCEEGERHMLADIPPELYYQALLEVVGPHVRKLWQVLSVDQDPEISNPLLKLSGANLCHVALILLAKRHDIPILTLNYDYRLENAAQLLGFKTSVRTPTENGWSNNSISERPIRIWKLRGSAISNNELDTGLCDLARIDSKTASSLVSLAEEHRICLLGYSGHDLDIFPFIIEATSEKSKLHWIDRQFPPDCLARHLSDQVITTEGDCIRFARSVLMKLHKSDAANIQSVEHNIRKAFSIKARRRRKSVEDAWHKESTVVLEKLLSSGLQSDGAERSLIHGLALAMIGEHLPRQIEDKKTLGALWYLHRAKRKSTNPRLIARANIVRAYSLSELSRYRDSETAAREAMSQARSASSTALYITALSSAASARYMQQFSYSGYGSKCAIALHRKAILEGIRQCLVLGRIRILRRKIDKDRPNPEETRALWAFDSQRIRITAMTQRIIMFLARGRMLQKVAARQLSIRWRKIESSCRSSGYAVGLANCRRYSEQLSYSPNEILSSNEVFSLVVARLERTLIQLQRIGAAKHPPKSGILQHRTRNCLKQAGELGSCALVLKSIVELKKLGEKITPSDLLKARCAISHIQSDSLDRTSAELLKWLQE